MKQVLIAIIAVATAVVPVNAYAATVYSGYTLYSGMGNEEQRATIGGNAVAARDAFLSGIGSIGSETFEGSFTSPATVESGNVVLNFGGGLTASTSDTLPTTANFGHVPAAVVSDAGATLGRFNTTPLGEHFLTSGINYDAMSGLNVTQTTLSVLKFTFSSPLSAFGFFITDLFDQGSNTYVVTNQGQGDQVLYDLNALFNDANPPPELPILLMTDDYNDNTGSLVFFGVRGASNINTVTVYSGPSSTAPDTDIFGIDDFYAQSSPNDTPVVPEPSTLALAGMALAGVGLRFRRRKAA